MGKNKDLSRFFQQVDKALTHSLQALDVLAGLQIDLPDEQTHQTNEGSWPEEHRIDAAGEHECSGDREQHLTRVQNGLGQVLVHSSRILREAVEYSTARILIVEVQGRTYQCTESSVMDAFAAAHAHDVIYGRA